MSRLIDADALLEAVNEHVKSTADLHYKDVLEIVTNAHTVQREGWVSVDELQKVYDDMFNHKDIARVAQSLWRLIHAK